MVSATDADLFDGSFSFSLVALVGSVAFGVSLLFRVIGGDAGARDVGDVTSLRTEADGKGAEGAEEPPKMEARETVAGV